KYAPNKYIATFSTMDGIKIANAESHNGHCLWDFCKYTAPKRYHNCSVFATKKLRKLQVQVGHLHGRTK
ncbi:hypothetical protein NIA13_14655, partial [Oscillibacter valericigenes]|nr:hypothetical protein [Oscillibacter valericigenes]